MILQTTTLAGERLHKLCYQFRLPDDGSKRYCRTALIPRRSASDPAFGRWPRRQSGIERMTMPKVFFSRCKPYGHDAVDVALKSNRLFFGYCMRKRDVSYDRRNLRSCIVDVTCDDVTWATEHFASDRNRQFNRNRNFVREIGPGSIALVPRPSSGVIYCGFVQGGFELVDEPAWYGTWESIWRASTTNDPDEFWIAGEVAQTWRVDEFRAIPVPRIPVWIRRSLFGRSTYGIVRPYGGLDPIETLKSIIASDSFIPPTWTIDPEEVERRLITDVTPSAFEHLVVSLLQLENPDEFWTHVGGSGNGGLDGIGANAAGEVVGLLQCKWAYWGEEPDLNTLWVKGTRVHAKSWPRLVTMTISGHPAASISSTRRRSQPYLSSTPPDSRRPKL